MCNPNKSDQNSRKGARFNLSLPEDLKGEFENFAAQQERSVSDFVQEAMRVLLGHQDTVWVRRPVWVTVEEWEEYRLDLAKLARELGMLTQLLLDRERENPQSSETTALLEKVKRASDRAMRVLPW